MAELLNTKKPIKLLFHDEVNSKPAIPLLYSDY
jgi:hypothetical protein